jgi:hypothetical protein
VIKKHGAAYFPGNRVGKRSRAVFFLTADKTLPPEKCNLPFNRIIGDHLDDAGPPAGFKKHRSKPKGNQASKLNIRRLFGRNSPLASKMSHELWQSIKVSQLLDKISAFSLFWIMF